MKSKLFSILIVSILVSQATAAEPKLPRATKPGDKSKFLEQFVGEWDRTTEMFFQPGKSTTTKGTMSAKMLGKFWLVIDLKGTFAGKDYHGRATYGFDTSKKKYVGVFTDTMAPIMWNYECNIEGNKFIVETQGPHPMMRGTFTFRNTWEVKSKDLIELNSVMENSEGKVTTILKATCRRKKPKE